MNTFESAIAFLAAKCTTSNVLTVTAVDENAVDRYKKIADELDVSLSFNALSEEIAPTELLYINTPAEGNYRAMELIKYSSKVSKYIILPNTVTHAHKPSNTIKLGDGITPIGLVFGINHFLQEHDNWFILEHDDLDPGMTILVNKDNVSC
jgi:hypothetical protein